MHIFNRSTFSRRCADSLAFLCAGAALALFFLVLAQKQGFALSAALGSLALGLFSFLLNKRSLMYLSMGCSALISYQHLEYQTCHQKGQLEARVPSAHASTNDLAPFDHQYLSHR
jgi:hypothetical protein